MESPGAPPGEGGAKITPGQDGAGTTSPGFSTSFHWTAAANIQFIRIMGPLAKGDHSREHSAAAMQSGAERWRSVAQQMRNHGAPTPEQCKNKWHNMSRTAKGSYRDMGRQVRGGCSHPVQRCLAASLW